jgi:hypothetical protein
MSQKPKSATHGILISTAEVTNVSPHGFWLLLGYDEKVLPFEDFSWFGNTTVGQICHVELLSGNHPYRPEPDIDPGVESIDDPDRYPLMSKAAQYPIKLDRQAR